MTIYIDIVLIENLIMNYIILYATGIITKTEVKYIRIFLGSLIGAIYAIVSYISILEIYSNIILKIILSIIIIYISFNPQTAKKMWKQVLIFYLTSFVFGGTALSLIYLIQPQNILMKNGMFLGTYPLKSVLLGGIIGFIIVNIAFRIVKNKISKNNMFCKIKVKLENKEIITNAMIDTGNLLKEPITSTPVVVMEYSLLYESVPKEILNNIENILGGDFEKIPEEIKNKYMAKLKVIPFSSLGKQNGMLLGIKGDEIEIESEDEKIKKDKFIIGIYDKSLTKRGEYRALLGIEMLN